MLVVPITKGFMGFYFLMGATTLFSCLSLFGHKNGTIALVLLIRCMTIISYLKFGDSKYEMT